MVFGQRRGAGGQFRDGRNTRGPPCARSNGGAPTTFDGTAFDGNCGAASGRLMRSRVRLQCDAAERSYPEAVPAYYTSMRRGVPSDRTMGEALASRPPGALTLIARTSRVQLGG